MRLIICPIRQIFIFLSFIMLSFGCKEISSKESEILSIPMELSIERFDKKFYHATADDIPELKTTYPFFFPEKFSDSVWIKRQKDSLQLLLLKNVEQKFASIASLEDDLEYLFKHLKYYKELLEKNINKL